MSNDLVLPDVNAHPCRHPLLDKSLRLTVNQHGEMWLFLRDECRFTRVEIRVRRGKRWALLLCVSTATPQSMPIDNQSVVHGGPTLVDPPLAPSRLRWVRVRALVKFTWDPIRERIERGCQCAACKMKSRARLRKLGTLE